MFLYGFRACAFVLSGGTLTRLRFRALFLDLNFHAFAFVPTGSLFLPLVRLPVFIYIQESQNRTARTGHAGRDMQGRTGQAEQDEQDRRNRNALVTVGLLNFSTHIFLVSVTFST